MTDDETLMLVPVSEHLTYISNPNFKLNGASDITQRRRCPSNVPLSSGTLLHKVSDEKTVVFELSKLKPACYGFKRT